MARVRRGSVVSLVKKIERSSAYPGVEYVQMDQRAERWSRPWSGPRFAPARSLMPQRYANRILFATERRHPRECTKKAA